MSSFGPADLQCDATAALPGTACRLPGRPATSFDGARDQRIGSRDGCRPRRRGCAAKRASHYPTPAGDVLLAHWNELVGALPPDLAHRRPCLLGPPEAFSDQPAPASYFNDWTGHDAARMGPSSIAVARRLASSCAGWPRRPSAAEFYAAVHADRPDARQQQLIAAWAQEAAYLDVIDAWGEHVYTIRELVAAFHKVEGLHTFTRFRWLNHMALVPEADGIPLWNC